MRTAAEIKRSNRRILIAMMIFALLLTVMCLLWMRGVMRSREAAQAEAAALITPSPNP